jgi:hypothetical protein
MSAFEFDFVDVPDQLQPLGPGIVDFQVEDVKKTMSAGDAAKGKVPKPMYEFHSKVATEGSPDKGRDHTTYAVPEIQIGKVTIKRLALSCGLTPDANLTTDAFKGRRWRGNVSNRSYTDASGRQRMVADVDILIPGDQGY